MSKAFTKESDDAIATPMRRRGVPVPEGVPNYLTAAGARALRAELDTLSREPRTADSDDRIRELSDHLATAEVVEAPADPERVGFGARVIVEDDAGERSAYHIVGALEAAPRDGAIGWHTPIGRALMGAHAGDIVALPRGEVEVVAIEYET